MLLHVCYEQTRLNLHVNHIQKQILYLDAIIVITLSYLMIFTFKMQTQQQNSRLKRHIVYSKNCLVWIVIDTRFSTNFVNFCRP